MDAVISGRAGRALLLDGESLKSFDVDDPSELVSRQQSDLPYLFGETQDLRVIENADLESIQQELKQDCEWNWALDLALISLDAELPDEIRKEALEGLDELLADNRVVERLENILYAPSSRRRRPRRSAESLRRNAIHKRPCLATKISRTPTVDTRSLRGMGHHSNQNLRWL